LRNVEIEFDDKLKAELESLEREILRKEKEVNKEFKGAEANTMMKGLRQEKDSKRKDIMARLEAERREAARKALKDLDICDTLDDDLIRKMISQFVPSEKMDKLNTDFNNKKSQYLEKNKDDIDKMRKKHGQELERLDKQLKNVEDAEAGDMLSDLVEK
jgi:regulator of protease activity HflC (stomatin/prohibitin superfamily)